MDHESKKKLFIALERAKAHNEQFFQPFLFILLLTATDSVDIYEDGQINFSDLAIVITFFIIPHVISRVLNSRRLRKIDNAFSGNSPKKMEVAILQGFFGRERLRLYEKGDDQASWAAVISMPQNYNYMDYKDKKTQCEVYFDTESSKPMFLEIGGEFVSLASVRSFWL